MRIPVVTRSGRLILLLSCLLGVPFDAAAYSWESRPGYRVAKLAVPMEGENGFTLLSLPDLGIQFTNSLQPQHFLRNHNLLNGAGVALGDVDGDGLPDLYFCNLSGENRLYRNLGNWKFEDSTEVAGVGCANQFSTGAVFADVNGDGHLDLLVTSNGGPNALFLNDGRGRFRDVTAEAGLRSELGSTSLALADVNGNGHLDLYVANYGVNTIRSGGMAISTRRVGGRDVVVGRLANRLKIVEGKIIEYGEPDLFYMNDGTGKFTALSWTGGKFLDSAGKSLEAVPWDMGLSVMFRDLNGDGWPDLYVCNDFQTPDRIWINDRRGGFQALAPEALPFTSYFSMTADFADVNRDGLVDIFVADMRRRAHALRMTQSLPAPSAPLLGETHDFPQVRQNTLFLNRGDETFAEQANYSGVDASDWTWCAVFLDVDLDGYEDLLVANGHGFDTEDMDAMEWSKRVVTNTRTNLLGFPKLETPNLSFRNRGDTTFEEVGMQWGFDSTQVSHGIALADLDLDGDLDVVVSCLNAPPLIYRNNSIEPRVAVRLKGAGGNTQGIGSKITLHGGPVSQSQEVISGGRYLSGDDPMRVFAAGRSGAPMRLEVLWRGGKRSVVEGVLPNHIYEIDERAAQPDEPETPGLPGQPVLFADQSDSLDFVHREQAFDDFALQPLLPRKLSQNGPGVAWFDLSGNGQDELILGNGRGERLSVFRIQEDGSFLPWRSSALDRPLPGDVMGLAGWTGPDGPELLVGISHYESGRTNLPNLFRLRAAGDDLELREVPGSALGAIGPLAVADFDGDGDLDLFVGGQAMPGRYPLATPSFLFRNEAGELRIDPVNSARLAEVGLVQGAVWSDLDGDGFPELILATEWGPIRVFATQQGELHEITASLGLAEQSGWWLGVATGDLDGDGRMDIVAGNWGLNSSYHQPSSENPIHLYWGDFSSSRVLDLVEAYLDEATGRVVPRRTMAQLGPNLPLIQTAFPTHRAFSTAAVVDLLGPSHAAVRPLTVNHLASTALLNRGGRFDPVALPLEAQLAPAFGVLIRDFDGDGREDVFLSQNFSHLRFEETPSINGRGLLLKGDGQGGLNPVPGAESGVRIYGDQRGAAAGDVNRNGRWDLLVAQNDGPARLLRNETGRAGLRVRLAGPPLNPFGAGAQLRVKAGAFAGPVREISFGSGYLSQNSPVQILALPPGGPARVWVRWPGGRVTESAIPAGAAEVQVSQDGALRLIR